MLKGFTGSAAFAILGYGTCSSVLLILNKLAVHLLPAPMFVLLAQVTCSWVAVKVCGLLGFIEVDELEWAKLRGFVFVSIAFLASIFANIKTLQYANVETFIVFRSSTPIVIGVADWLFLNRELPNLRSALSICALAGGSILYVLTDAAFVVRGYVWVCVWFVIFCFDQLYIKHAVDSVKVRSNWGRVFFTNLWASAFLAVSTLATEPQLLLDIDWSMPTVLALAVSCVVGVAMSYFAFLCRAAVSATSFTVIGNVCKIITVLINISIWDKHASPLGICFLLVCLLAAGAYQQAPLRDSDRSLQKADDAASLLKPEGESDLSEPESGTKNQQG
uniref:Sugar phosphate transporter domain-containing protein n=1 Tax=Chrysotila carterae TaxID=13221 RepID=A0A7S4AZ37_CHRCT|mmetsp:Transcript_11311/g.24200  ORF Transcript_11311/g.24200 Transcript_11311/m.24200 type:complete len:333 (+) Transcript_11311:592-1590(+)